MIDSTTSGYLIYEWKTHRLLSLQWERSSIHKSSMHAQYQWFTQHKFSFSTPPRLRIVMIRWYILQPRILDQRVEKYIDYCHCVERESQYAKQACTPQVIHTKYDSLSHTTSFTQWHDMTIHSTISDTRWMSEQTHWLSSWQTPTIA